MSIKRGILTFAFVTGFSAMALGGPGSDPVQPPVLPDLNPDPDVVEVVLIAHTFSSDFGTGTETPVYGYNGSTPGPTIEAEVGNTLIVHFFNLLPEDTTVHWHGVETPAHMDGSNIAQGAVPSGGYFRYEFPLRRAAMFWYHPHIRTHVQVEKGLYGAIMVRDTQGDEGLGLPASEHVLVLDDILLAADSTVAEPFPTDPLANAKMQLNGREGNLLLVNGRAADSFKIRRGVPQRLRVVNTANSRFMRISIPGHTMWRIGGDGGLLEEALEIPPVEQVPDPDNPGSTMSDPDLSVGLVLTPGERADLVFTPAGKAPVVLEWHDMARGRHSTFYMPSGAIGIGDLEGDGTLPPVTMATFKLTGPEAREEWVPPSPLRAIDVVDASGQPMIPVRMGHTPPDANGDVTFFVAMKDGMPLPFSMVTAADAPTVTIGDVRIMDVWNMTGGMHNFHMHGFTFQHIETIFMDMMNPGNNYTVPATYVEDKDTILLPARPGGKGTSRSVTRLAVRFSDTGREGQAAASGKVPGENSSGGWVFHCHLLEHTARGMMSFLQVMNP